MPWYSDPTKTPERRIRHVLAADAAGDISAVLKAATNGKSLPWRVPKNSQADEPIVFFLPRIGFTARGVIATEPRMFERGRYTARVRYITLLACAVPLAFIKRNFQDWGWLNAKIKSYTTIDVATEAQLEKLICEYQSSFAEPLTEGAAKSASIMVYERNPLARQECIAHYGTDCHACGLSFGATYGETAEGYIHVHHLKPMAGERDGRAVDPIKDLRPICPNCHAVIHRQNPPLSIAELRRMLSGGSPLREVP